MFEVVDARAHKHTHILLNTTRFPYKPFTVLFRAQGNGPPPIMDQFIPTAFSDQ